MISLNWTISLQKGAIKIDRLKERKILKKKSLKCCCYWIVGSIFCIYIVGYTPNSHRKYSSNRLVISVKRVGVHCLAVMFLHRKEDMDLVKVVTLQWMDINQVEIQMHTKDCQHVKKILVGTTTNTILSRFFFWFYNHFRRKIISYTLL